jgi:hypothetical protein
MDGGLYTSAAANSISKNIPHEEAAQLPFQPVLP